MYRKFVIVLISFCSFSIFAQDLNSSVSTKVNKSSTSLKTFELSAGYLRNDLKYSGGTKVTGDGFFLTAGKIFNLSDYFTTTTNLTGNYLFLDDKDYELNDGSAKAYDLGLYQRFSYNIYAGQTVIRPFFEVGFALGRISAKDQDVGYNPFWGEYSKTEEMDINYDRYSMGFGVQIVLPNGLTPFAKYTASRVQASDKARYRSSTTIDGVQIENLDEEYTNSERDLTAQIFYAGVGYLF